MENEFVTPLVTQIEFQQSPKASKKTGFVPAFSFIKDEFSKFRSPEQGHAKAEKG